MTRLLVIVILSVFALGTAPARAHDSASQCTERDHPTPSGETTVPVTNTRVWQGGDGYLYADGATGWVAVGPGGLKANVSGERANGTPLEGTPVQAAMDGTGARVSPGAATTACIEAAGSKVER
jgi:hypothetical protein